MESLGIFVFRGRFVVFVFSNFSEVFFVFGFFLGVFRRYFFFGFFLWGFVWKCVVEGFYINDSKIILSVIKDNDFCFVEFSK